MRHCPAREGHCAASENIELTDEEEEFNIIMLKGKLEARRGDENVNNYNESKMKEEENIEQQ